MLLLCFLAIVLAGAGVLLMVWAFAYRRLAYSLTESAVRIESLGRTVVVPYQAIQGIYTGQRLEGHATPSALRNRGSSTATPSTTAEILGPVVSCLPSIWLAAIEHPRPFAAWILIEEKAEGGDMLAHIARERPVFLEGYERVCDGAGLALYRRREDGATPPQP